MVCNVWFEWLSFSTHLALLPAPNNPPLQKCGGRRQEPICYGIGRADFDAESVV